jgi:hypothetical protein
VSKVYKAKTLPVNVKAVMKAGGVVEAVVPFDIWELIGHDTEGVNDLAEKRIVREGNAVLTDIHYEPAGVSSPVNKGGTKDVLVRVTATLEPF